VNNAGIIRRAPAMTHSWEDWQQTIALDLSAPFLLSQALARQLVAREAPGKIVNVASMLSFQGGYLVPGYTAAKSGIAGLTRALANEWARHGINVNAIAPGYMATELTAMLRSDRDRAETMLARIPAGRWGEPEDLAGAVIFLCSHAADYVHGTVLPIDGGWLSW
jgi:2-deoxy-D-gluconate 3-dehydrogenase